MALLASHKSRVYRSVPRTSPGHPAALFLLLIRLCIYVHYAYQTKTRPQMARIITLEER